MIHIKSNKEEHMLCGIPKQYVPNKVMRVDVLLGDEIYHEIDIENYCKDCFRVYDIHKALVEISKIPEFHNFSLYKTEE